MTPPPLMPKADWPPEAAGGFMCWIFCHKLILIQSFLNLSRIHDLQLWYFEPHISVASFSRPRLFLICTTFVDGIYLAVAVPSLNFSISGFFFWPPLRGFDIICCCIVFDACICFFGFYNVTPSASFDVRMTSDFSG